MTETPNRRPLTLLLVFGAVVFGMVYVVAGIKFGELFQAFA